LFLHYYNKSGLATYKKQGAFDANIAKIILTKCFEKSIQNNKERVVAVQENTHYLILDNK